MNIVSVIMMFIPIRRHVRSFILHFMFINFWLYSSDVLHSLCNNITMHWYFCLHIYQRFTLSLFAVIKKYSLQLHCWLGDRKGIRPVKSWVLIGWWHCDWSFARVVAPVVTTTSIILSSNKIQNGDILALANPGPPGKMERKRHIDILHYYFLLLHTYWLCCSNMPCRTMSVCREADKVSLHCVW